MWWLRAPSMSDVRHVDYLWALERAAELIHSIGIEVQKQDAEAAQELSTVVITLKTLQAQIEFELSRKKRNRLN